MPSTTQRRRSVNRRKPAGSTGNFGRGTRSSAFGSSTGRTKNYTAVRNDIQCKINSFRCLYAQTNIAGRNKPSPAILNKFSNLVSKGAVVHKVSGSTIAKWNKNKTQSPSFTMSWAMKGLKSKYGAAVKAVCPTGNGRQFLVATTPTFKGKTVKFPT